MQDASEFIEWLQQRGLAQGAEERAFVGRHVALYRALHAETPQWLGTLHAAMFAGAVEPSLAALGALKERALRESGAGAAAWRLLHTGGDQALTRHALLPGTGNLVALLKIVGSTSPAWLPDPRLIDLLCDSEEVAWRHLPGLDAMPAAVLRAVQRALRNAPLDFGEHDVGLRSDVRRVLDWAHHEPGSAGVFAVTRGWQRLVHLASEWLDAHPGRGAPAALPLRICSGHLEAIQLRTSVELERESMRMRNCLGGSTAAADLRRPDRAFFSIRERRSARIVADLELAYWPRSRRWAIDQVKGPANREAAPDVRAFARALCASFSPRLQLRAPKALPPGAASWADAHPDPGAARLAARFAMMLSRHDPAWVAPFVTRASRYRGSLGIETGGDALLATWRREFCRRPRGAKSAPPAPRLLRLPSDERNAPHCLFDLGGGPRAVAFAADGDGRLGVAREVFDRACIARWLESRDEHPLPLSARAG